MVRTSRNTRSYSSVRASAVNGVVVVRQDGIDKALIPYLDREKFVINTHLDPMLGHVGKEKLADRISTKAYVLNLGRII